MIIQGDCLKMMNKLNVKVDGVLTSPPYNLGHNPLHGRLEKNNSMYNEYYDNLQPVEWIIMMMNCFYHYEKIVKERGVILLNLSYSSKNAILPFQLLNNIHEQTEFTVRDVLIWKKSITTPFQTSPINVSRICEFVFVSARKNVDFISNKNVSYINEKSGQQFYEYVNNFIEAPNNDSVPGIKHNATFSIDFADQLIKRYFPPKSLILDNFMGIGTTGIACENLDRDFVGIEINSEYVEIAIKRIEDNRVRLAKLKNIKHQQARI